MRGNKMNEIYYLTQCAADVIELLDSDQMRQRGLYLNMKKCSVFRDDWSVIKVVWFDKLDDGDISF